MKLGVYIGSFNPPHIGHIDVVNYLINNNYIDEVLIVPTGNYWNKQDLEDIEDRINMLKLFENENIHIDTIHNNIPYTYLLMRMLKEEYDADLYLIIGADNIINFYKWKNYEELLNYKIIVMERDNIDIESYLKKYDRNSFIVISNYPYINISSTEIREGNKDCQVDAKVLKYIRENGLYGKK